MLNFGQNDVSGDKSQQIHYRRKNNYTKTSELCINGRVYDKRPLENSP